MKDKFEDKSVTLSDWATDDQLTPEQVHYAAEDAMNSYRIFRALIAPKMNEIGQNHKSSSIHELCFGIIDCNESWNRIKHKKSKKTKNSKDSKSKKIGNSTDSVHSVNDNDTEHTALYDNCRILRPDRSFLSWCRRRTLDRYIKKGFAERVDENTIRLLFDPKQFTRKPKNEVVLGFKKNECAVCGESRGKLQRYYVVPYVDRILH